MCTVAWVFLFLFAMIGLVFTGVVVALKPEHRRYSYATRGLLGLISPLYLLVYGIGKIYDRMPPAFRGFLIIGLNGFIIGFVIWLFAQWTDGDTFEALCASYLLFLVIWLWFGVICALVGENIIEKNLGILLSKSICLYPITLVCLVLYSLFILCEVAGGKSDE